MLFLSGGGGYFWWTLMVGFWVGWLGVWRGGKFFRAHKECSVATHHLSSSEWQKTQVGGVPKWCQKGAKIVEGPPPPGEFSATEASCGKTPGLDQYWHPGVWQTSYTNY